MKDRPDKKPRRSGTLADRRGGNARLRNSLSIRKKTAAAFVGFLLLIITFSTAFCSIYAAIPFPLDFLHHSTARGRKNIICCNLELAMIRARVRSGMENARAKGKRIGRPQMTADSIPAAFLRHYPAYKAGRLNVSELAKVCDLSRTTAYKYIGLLEG